MSFDIQGLIKGLIAQDSFLTQIVVYNAVGQILQPLLGPYVQQLLNDANAANPNVPLSPADLADMVIRGVKTESEVVSQALKAGLNADDFHNLILNNGEPPGLESVLLWARRGFIPYEDVGVDQPSVARAIKTSRIKDYWTDAINKSQWLPLTIADAVNAWVRNQIPESLALQHLEWNGITNDLATILHNTNGRPPAPGQLGELVNRGFIPIKGTGPDALTFEQGVTESDIKDKWEPLLENLIIKLPGIFEIRLMQSQGAITADQAYTLYREEGLPQTVAQSATAAASASKTTKVKQLSEATVEKLYNEQLISASDASTDLGKLGYDAAESAYILSVWDQALAAKRTSTAVNAIKTKYVGHHISIDTAAQLLGELGISQAQAQALLDVWVVEHEAMVKDLTEAQIVDAVEYSIVTPDYAISRLVGLGYSAVDAWMVLSIKLKTRVQPEPDNAPSAPTPPPATTTTP